MNLSQGFELLRRYWKITSASLLLLAVGTVLEVGSCSRSGSILARETRVAPTVPVSKVTREDLSHAISLTAEFRPYQEVDMHAKVSGYVKEILVDVGDHVKEGQVLAILELPEMQDDLKKATAATSTAEQEINRAQAAFDESNVGFTRLQSAVKALPNLIAQQDMDTAAARNRAAAANLEASRQKLNEAIANADHFRTMLGYAKITAPFDGVVTRRYADTGALIQAGTTSNTQAMPLVRLAQSNRLRLVFPVPESAVSEVHIGDPVEVDVLSLNKTFRAKICRFTQKVDTATRTMLTEVDVENLDYRFTPGMYATAKLILQEKRNALSVPIQSITSGATSSVLVVNQKGLIEERNVTLGLETSTRAEILAGLKENDLVLMGSRGSFQEGQAVISKLVEGKNL